jgi:lauroyl/myristoyl acyltransferase
MEAAFLDIGRGRNGVLYAGEVNYSPEDLEGPQPRIEQILKNGQPVMVQVTKDPMGGKGARLTAQISMPGRFLVFVPNANISGISRRLPDDERRRLKTIMKKVRPEGHGVIVVMGHIGNWEVQFRANRIYTGLEQNAVMAPQRSTVMNDWLIRQRTRGGDHMVSSQEGALPIVRLLRRGQIVGMLGDQDSARVRGIFVNFFGRPACTPAGIGLLCHLSKAPILPAAGYRMKDRPDHHVVTWGEPIRPDPSLDAETDMLRITQAYTKWLEDYIREHPEQWVWIHHRWKRKPE